MTNTLDSIINDLAANFDDTTSGLKKLKETLDKAKETYDNAKESDKGGEKQKLNAAQKEYDDKRGKIVSLIKNKIDEAAESNTLALYSQEVAERRKARKAASIEDDITKVQGQIDIFSLEIADIDRDIEEKRKTFAPA